MELSKLEKETILTYNEAEATATVYTHNRALLHRLEKLAAQRPGDCCKTRDFPSGAAEYTVPKQWVKVSPPRVASEAQKAAARAALDKVRAKREV